MGTIAAEVTVLDLIRSILRAGTRALIIFGTIGVLIVAAVRNYLAKLIEIGRDDPEFMVFTLIALVCGLPLVLTIGYFWGRRHEENKSLLREDRIQQMFNTVLATLTSGSRSRSPSTGGGTTSNSPFPRPIKLITNGGQGSSAREAVDYSEMMISWVEATFLDEYRSYGFTRESLKAAGAWWGANENYTWLTHYLLDSNIIREAVGTTPYDTPDKRPSQMYVWADQNERPYTKGQLVTFAREHTFTALEREN